LEANVYNILGPIPFDEGRTEEGARRAVDYYEKVLKLSESIGDIQSIAMWMLGGYVCLPVD
jgi:hypothetical protein